MAISLHAISAPIFSRHLGGLANVMRKAQALYRERNLDESALLAYRLYPDMFNFTRQVQLATDHAATCMALLGEVAPLRIEGEEGSLQALIDRVERTIAYVKAVPEEPVNAAEAREVVLKMRERELRFKGIELLQNRSLPNFYFHCTTAYDIIRHNGVEIGKRDFMGAA